MSSAARSSLCAIIITLMVALSAPPSALHADNSSLSSYWQPSITHWADLIEQSATDNGLDPDLVAAIVEEESKGDPRLVSTAGAVGLMQIMPYETGFTWRPRAARLKNPATNLEWGTNTLSQVIRQAQGRISLGLLAYNSGWDRIHLHSTRIFATKVLDHYARCILIKNRVDLKQLRSYTLVIIAHSSASPIHVDRVKSSGLFEPLPGFDPASLPADLPHAVAYAAIDNHHIAWWVEVWVEPVMNEAAISPVRGLSRHSRE